MKTLVVQRGHVPRTTGATGGPGEQAMARRVAARIQQLMAAVPGWQLRIIDADEPAARYRGDAFVAIHGDASTSPTVGGASVGWRNGPGRALGAAWKAAYRRHGWPYSFRADNYTAALSGYYGHRHAVAQGNVRAVIVEVGFMTNPTERRWIDSDAGTTAIARSVIEAVTGHNPATEEGPMAWLRRNNWPDWSHGDAPIYATASTKPRRRVADLTVVEFFQMLVRVFRHFHRGGR